MRVASAAVRDWQLDRCDGHEGPMKAASLVKQVIGHVALVVLDDLDEPVSGDITARHVLSHTTGLPNWRTGAALEPLRPAGMRWGYSGEGFVLLQAYLERRSGRPITNLVRDLVTDPIGMRDTVLEDPETGYHGYRPMLTTAADYGRFLAHVLRIDDERWCPQVTIDSELAWGAGWGLELGPPVWGWQWGFDESASNFVLGCPSTGDGFVVFTDANELGAYREIVEQECPGDHASLRAWENEQWLALFT